MGCAREPRKGQFQPLLLLRGQVGLECVQEKLIPQFLIELKPQARAGHRGRKGSGRAAFPGRPLAPAACDPPHPQFRALLPRAVKAARS